MNIPTDLWRHIISYNNPESDKMLNRKDRNKLTNNYVCMYNQTRMEYIKSNYKVGDIIRINDANRLGVIVDMNPTRLAKKSHHYKLSYVSVARDIKNNNILERDYNCDFDDREEYDCGRYEYNFLKYNVKCVYANQVEDKHRILNLNVNNIRKYKFNDTIFDLSHIKQYDIVKFAYHTGNNINSFNEQLRTGKRIYRTVIVYTGEGRCMKYNDFLEYENLRGIKSHAFSFYNKNVMRCKVVKDDINTNSSTYLTPQFEARVLKDREQYYRRRLK